MKVWIDLANSPHPLLFAPLARRMRERGDEIAVTVRDHAQTAELAREHFPDAEVIGDASPSGRLAKTAAIGARVGRLRAWAGSERPDVALSHNSYAQILAARSRRIPALTAMDFEHQPANHVAFRAADRILVPEALPVAELRKQGATDRKRVTYPGLKEELYLADFDADPDILDSLGIERDPETVVVVARSAPAGAAYHRGENPIFDRVLRKIDAQRNARCVVLARHPSQRAHVRELGLHHCIVPEGAIDSRSLLCAADLFVGAGGTMSREAALLGLRTYTIFAGPRPAVDRHLEARGDLELLSGPAELRLEPAAAGREAKLAELREGGERIQSLFIEQVDQLAARSGS